jgi:hypothetical protein
MTDRPAFFVVTRWFGREMPAIYWDELPQAPIRNLVYVQRLDLFPNSADLVRAPLAKLFAVYQHLKRRGKLPPRWEPPKPKKEAPPPGASTRIRAASGDIPEAAPCIDRGAPPAPINRHQRRKI